MKAITSREMVDYLYYAVVVPLKELDVPSFEPDNPFTRLNRNADLKVRVKEPSESFNHNYQRYEHNRTANLIVIYTERYNEVTVAEYSRNTRTLTIFEDVAKRNKLMPFMSRLHRLFEKSAPYYKVRMQKERHYAL